MKMSFYFVWLFFNGVIHLSTLQPREKEEKKKKKNLKYKLLKKIHLRNTLEATKHKLFEQLKKTEKNTGSKLSFF